MTSNLSTDEKRTLLSVARTAITASVQKKPLPEIDLAAQTPILREDGVCFVTLMKKGILRGCIGALEPYQPLILDVQQHAVAAAMHDYRFPNLRFKELTEIQIEISRLTPIQPIDYENVNELVSSLKPNVDGVLIKSDNRKATFLPQVWEKIPDPEQFLSQLCMKIGANPDLWRTQPIDVYIYQIEKIKE